MRRRSELEDEGKRWRESVRDGERVLEVEGRDGERALEVEGRKKERKSFCYEVERERERRSAASEIDCFAELLTGVIVRASSVLVCTKYIFFPSLFFFSFFFSSFL